MTRASFALACTLTLAVAGCTRPGMATSDVSDSTFVRTMVALRKLELDQSVDSATLDSARRVVLRRHGVTVNQLETKARALAGDAQHASDVWRAIDRGLVASARKPERP